MIIVVLPKTANMCNDACNDVSPEDIAHKRILRFSGIEYLGLLRIPLASDMEHFSSITAQSYFFFFCTQSFFFFILARLFFDGSADCIIRQGWGAYNVFLY